MNVKRFTYGSAFTGIGGSDLAMENAGFTGAFQIEIDKDCNAVLDKRFPGRKAFRDIKQVEADSLDPCDVFCFGSPCQDLSVAGARKGLDGERSVLFYDAIRLIRDLRARHGKPRFAIWENVPGALSSNGARDFAEVLRTFRLIGATDVAWAILDARFFGVPQRRRRVFVVADFGGQRAEEILSLAEGLRGHLEESQQPRPRPAREAVDGPGECGDPRREFLRRLAWRMGVGNSAGGRAIAFADEDGNPYLPGQSAVPLPEAEGASPEVASTLTSGHHGKSNPSGRRCEDDFNLVATVTPRIERPDRGDSGHDSQLVAMLDMAAYNIQTNDGGDHKRKDRPEGGLYVSEAQEALTIGSTDQTVICHASGEEEVAATIGQRMRGQDDSCADNLLAVAFESRIARNGRGKPSDVVPPLKAQSGRSGKGDGAPAINGAPWGFGVRRLTPNEGARLQGFSDEWNSFLSDSARYKQFGNAICVPVFEWIARRVKAVLDEEAEADGALAPSKPSRRRQGKSRE